MNQKHAYNLDNEGARTRTWDLLLKRQLLYQLSYAPDDGLFHRTAAMSLA